MSLREQLEGDILGQEILGFSQLHGFSSREMEVFGLLVRRLTNTDLMAERLGVSKNTIRNHFQNIFFKTKTTSKTELLASFINRAFSSESGEPVNEGSSSLNVLMVGNDEEFAEMTKRALWQVGQKADLKLVTDMSEALQLLGAMQSGETDEPQLELRCPDLMFMDLMLDGSHFQAVQQIKSSERLSSLPIIVLSDSDDQQVIARSYASGCNSLVKKPASYRPMLQLMKSITDYWVSAVGVQREIAR